MSDYKALFKAAKAQRTATPAKLVRTPLHEAGNAAFSLGAAMQTLKCLWQFIAVEGPIASLEGPEGGSSSGRGRGGRPPEGSGGEHTGIAPCHIKACTMHAWQCHP